MDYGGVRPGSRQRTYREGRETGDPDRRWARFGSSARGSPRSADALPTRSEYGLRLRARARL
eukprot:scaffold26586_cov126-Isochrysis_galbana.AAC.3